MKEVELYCPSGHEVKPTEESDRWRIWKTTCDKCGSNLNPRLVHPKENPND